MSTIVKNLDAPKWLVDKLIGLGICEAIKPYRKSCEFLVTDIFGTALEVGQEVLYARNNPMYTGKGKEVCECKILGILENGSLILQNKRTEAISTISSFIQVYADEDWNTARYMQIYVKPQ